jgi:acyl transferase domain-containing protein
MYVKGGHFLAEDPFRFDAPFFNITREEAAAMDPQHRLVLECSYEALENSGTPMKDIIGSDTSVFMGSFCSDWKDLLNRDIEALPFYHATGTGQALLANRLSYFYDLKGPSVSIDTACSSSLVALHLACQSLRSGESKQAIVGGSNVMLSHETMIAMSRMRFVSASYFATSFKPLMQISGFYPLTDDATRMIIAQMAIRVAKG